jgi:ABC-type polysaccharide/polyol phosphate export permease
MVLVFASIFATTSVIEDRHAGFLQAVLVGPGSRLAMVAGKCGVAWAALLGAVVATSLALTAVGFALAWWLDNLQAFHAVQMTLLLPLWAVSGAMFPAPSGGPLAAVVHANPVTYAVSAVRRALHGEVVASDFGVIGATLVVSLAFAAFAVRPRRGRPA